MEALEFSYEGTENVRLDKLLLERISHLLPEGFSRSQLKGWIEAGNVSVNGVISNKAGTVIKNGYTIKVVPPAPEPTSLAAYEFKLNVLFEDTDLIVIDKPAGLTVHPGAGNKDRTLLNALVHRSGSLGDFEDKSRPGVVHRLDKDTSGILVLAKNTSSLNLLSRQFAERSVGRAYKALVFSTPRAQRKVNLEDSGCIKAAIGRHPTQRTQMAVLQEGGKGAVTHWKVLERMPYGTLLEVRLETGRTHQIRVHMNHILSPVIGDPLYGDFSGLPHDLRLAAQRFGRQALHAYKLEIDHPVTGERLAFTSEVPADFDTLIAEFRAYRG